MLIVVGGMYGGAEDPLRRLEGNFYTPERLSTKRSFAATRSDAGGYRDAYHGAGS
jgi:hypothetical protein